MDATAATLYLERLNGRADITCTPAGVTGASAQFACQASDGQAWSVSGTTPANLSSIIISPSMYLRSARFDASAAVAAIRECQKISGHLPQSAPAAQTVHASLDCGAGAVTLYLRPGDSLDYVRTDTSTYRLTVVASDGETVTYDNTTNQYR